MTIEHLGACAPAVVLVLSVYGLGFGLIAWLQGRSK